MRSAVVFDTEYLAIEGSVGRFWAGPRDPDPTIIQIGAVKIDLESGGKVLDELNVLIRPVARSGEVCTLNTYIENLTGITNEEVARDGVPLATALRRFDQFSDGDTCWSWGKDELIALAISCYVHEIPLPMSIRRFGNCKSLLMTAGVGLELVESLHSGQLASHFGLRLPPKQAHDALFDAKSIAATLANFLRVGKLNESDFYIG